MWLGASSRVALPVVKTEESLSKVYLPSGLGYLSLVLPMNIPRSSLRCQESRPGGSLPLVAIARLTSGAPSTKPFWNGWGGVAPRVELFADRGVFDRLFVGLERGLAAHERRVDRLSRQLAGHDAVVHALQCNGVDHAGAVTHEQRARHRELRHRPVAPAGQSLGAPGNALAALQDAFHQRMHLELLQQVVGGSRRIGVLEVDHEADRDEVIARLLILHRVEPGAANLPVFSR